MIRGSKHGAPGGELSRVVAAADVAGGQRMLAIEASAAECEALARRLGVVGVERLNAELRLAADPTCTQLSVDGTLEADVVQRCVVSLSEFRSTLVAPVARLYRTDAVEVPPSPDIEAADDDMADPLVNGRADVGEAVAEQLALEIDPFPRKEGVEFKGYSTEPPEQKPVDSPVSPFAVLGRLKKRR